MKEPITWEEFERRLVRGSDFHRNGMCALSHKATKMIRPHGTEPLELVFGCDADTHCDVRLEFLKEPYPASTCVGVTALAIPGLQIEIEATAVL